MGQTDSDLILYARNASERLKVPDTERVKVVDGDFKDNRKLTDVMKGIDLVFLNTLDDREGVKSILQSMEETGVIRIIGATSLGIYDEVPGKFGEWNKKMLGDILNEIAITTGLIEDSSMNYTLLLMSWLYNEEGNISIRLHRRENPLRELRLPGKP